MICYIYIVTKIKDHRAFINDLILAFPEIEEEVLDEDNLNSITLQMIGFKAFTQKAIDSNDVETIKRCFEFVSSNWNSIEFKVENSLMITYLAKLKIVKGSNAERLLPAVLETALNEYRDAMR